MVRSSPTASWRLPRKKPKGAPDAGLGALNIGDDPRASPHIRKYSRIDAEHGFDPGMAAKLAQNSSSGRLERGSLDGRIIQPAFDIDDLTKDLQNFDVFDIQNSVIALSLGS